MMMKVGKDYWFYYLSLFVMVIYLYHSVHMTLCKKLTSFSLLNLHLFSFGNVPEPTNDRNELHGETGLTIVSMVVQLVSIFATVVGVIALLLTKCGQESYNCEKSAMSLG